MGQLDSWQEEMQSAYLYNVMADVERDEVRKQLFVNLANAARHQAGIWADVTAAHNPLPRSYRPNARAKLVAVLIRALGPRNIKPVLAAMKVRGLSVYSSQTKMPGHHMPASIEEVGYRHRSVRGATNLRAAVFGINDGLVSNASLIMGMAGAFNDPKVVYLAGVAGLLAGAFSMAAGEYVSMRSQRELYEYQIGLERDELQAYPEEETEELALIYAARGVPLSQARDMACQIMRDPDQALATLAREELGLNPDDLGSPWAAARASFLAFSVGAIVPLLPFAFGYADIMPIATVTGLALFFVGASLSLFTGKGALLSGLRMVLIGGSAGFVTYIVGRFIGTALG